jgi:hypothetical protein
MSKNIKEYVLKNYPARFKKDDNIVIEERQKHYVVYTKDKSPVFLSKNELK